MARCLEGGTGRKCCPTGRENVVGKPDDLIVALPVSSGFGAEGPLQIGEPLVAVQAVLTNASPGALQHGTTLHSHPGCDQFRKGLPLATSPAWYRHQHCIPSQGAAIGQKLNQSLQLSYIRNQALSDDKLAELS